MNSQVRALSILILLMMISFTATAQKQGTDGDYVENHPEFYKVLIDNNNIRVLEYTLEPGEKEGWHTHPEGMLYTVDGGPLKVEFRKGDPMIIEEIEGEAKYFEETPEHTAENINKTPVKLIIVELKNPVKTG